MSQILNKNDNVYGCDVCKRSIRVPSVKTGIDIVQRCIITNRCPGKMHRIFNVRDINSVSSIPPEVAGVDDWNPRSVLYTHTQTIADDKWVIHHNLQNKPKIHAFTNNDAQQYIPIQPTSINTIDPDTTELIFPQPVSGTAQCVTLTSANDNPRRDVVVVPTDVAITSAGELTLATIDSSAIVDVVITYLNVLTQTPVSVIYTNIGGSSILSPWANVNFVVSNGTLYSVRSFNIIDDAPEPNQFTLGNIINGDHILSIEMLNDGSDILLLAATYPYKATDRMYDKVVVANAINTSPNHQLYYNKGDLMSSNTIFRQVYPHITPIV